MSNNLTGAITELSKRINELARTDGSGVRDAEKMAYAVVTATERTLAMGKVYEEEPEPHYPTGAEIRDVVERPIREDGEER